MQVMEGIEEWQRLEWGGDARVMDVPEIARCCLATLTSSCILPLITIPFLLLILLMFLLSVYVCVSDFQTIHTHTHSAIDNPGKRK